MMGWRCIYLLSIPRAVHGVEMAESDRVALYAADGAPRAAILLTGHVRTLPRALATRPCSKDGSASQRPKWVQDHVGYASPATFRKFSVNVQRYNLRKATRAHPGQARNPSRCKPKSPVACDVLREWALSVRGLEEYDLQEQYRDVASSTPAYLENCPKAATPVIPAYLRFPRP